MYSVETEHEKRAFFWGLSSSISWTLWLLILLPKPVPQLSLPIQLSAHLALLLLLLQNTEPEPAFITEDESEQLLKLLSNIHQAHLEKKREKPPNPQLLTNCNLVSSSSMSKEIISLKKLLT